MTTLLIKDIAATTELDHSAMASVRGGSSGYYKGSVPSWMPGYGATDTSIKAEQLIGQCQDVVNNNGNNVAFANCISSTVNPTQTGNNNIHF
jgi:hypothetical protein